MHVWHLPRIVHFLQSSSLIRGLLSSSNSVSARTGSTHPPSMHSPPGASATLFTAPQSGSLEPQPRTPSCALPATGPSRPGAAHSAIPVLRPQQDFSAPFSPHSATLWLRAPAARNFSKICPTSTSDASNHRTTQPGNTLLWDSNSRLDCSFKLPDGNRLLL